MSNPRKSAPQKIVRDELESGEYALVVGGTDSQLTGKSVFLSKKDEFGWWECYDKWGDLLIIEGSHLMALTKSEWRDGDEVSELLFQR